MVSVSFLSSKYDVTTTVKKIDETNADYIHVDIMDGLFVNNTSFTKEQLDDALVGTKKTLDVHLMVNNPTNYIEYFSKFNTEYITFHLECLDDPMDVINAIRNKNMKVGIAINPKTPVNLLRPYLDLIDLVLIMCVEPGLGGQTFIPESVDKIKEISSLKSNFIVSVDGGINGDTYKSALAAGADILVSGSYICKEDDYNTRIDLLKCL